MCLQCCSKLVTTKRWVAEIVRQRVSGHRADNRECPTTELAATMSWNDELTADVISISLTGMARVVSSSSSSCSSESTRVQQILFESTSSNHMQLNLYILVPTKI